MMHLLTRGGAALGLLGSLLITGCASVPGTLPADAAHPAEAAASSSNTATLARPGDTALKALESSARRKAGSAGGANAPLSPEEALASRDLWARIRSGFAIPDLDNELVRNREEWYAERPDYVQRMTERSSRYLFHIVEEIERRNMPTELALLPFIESAFNPQAMSVAKASGMWQFIPSTGKYFDLKQNLFRDERRDVLASTRAALDYLSKLYGMFGDWHLALAAYNWGEGSVQRAVERNRKAGLPIDYMSLRMPAETRYYVPKLQAVKNIIAHPEQFSLSLPAIENHPYFLSVPIERDIDVALAAKLAGLTLDEFRALNPSLNKPLILAAGTPQVLLPYSNANHFITNLARHNGPTASWTAWVVPKTMRPSDAAELLDMNEATLREINKIPPRMLVKAGSTLLVPRTGERQEDVEEHIADNAMMHLAPDVPPARRVLVRATKRDTVASLAKRYKLAVADVAQWNRISTSARFARGQKVVVYLPQGTAATRLAAKSVRKAASPIRVAKSSAKSSVGKAASRVRLASKSANRHRLRVAKN